MFVIVFVGEPARIGHACYMCGEITSGEFRDWLCHACDDKNREVGDTDTQHNVISCQIYMCDAFAYVMLLFVVGACVFSVYALVDVRCLLFARVVGT